MTVVFVPFCYDSNSTLNEAYKFLLHVGFPSVNRILPDSERSRPGFFPASVWLEFIRVQLSFSLSVNLLLRGVSLWQGQGLRFFPQAPLQISHRLQSGPTAAAEILAPQEAGHECPSSSSSFFSHFLLPLFQLSRQPASSFCHTAHLPPSLTFPPSTSLLPCPPPYLSPRSFLTSSCPPLTICRKH